MKEDNDNKCNYISKNEQGLGLTSKWSIGGLFLFDITPNLNEKDIKTDE